ncbi:MAG TPA: Na(+)/H(+) antiporter subunit C [Actinomycetes bacterium]|nr:Na(+)/H(+) antiporter subunit C [Actinomycetes bacterium]
MNANVALILTAAGLIGCGVYLLLERSLTRVLVGLVLISNGVNVLFLVSAGKAGTTPIVGVGAEGEMSDPLPQALVLTAIVITLGTTAFLLAMAYRSWQLTGHDDVQDDIEDAAIRDLAAADETSDSFDLSLLHTNDTERNDDTDSETDTSKGPSR